MNNIFKLLAALFVFQQFFPINSMEEENDNLGNLIEIAQTPHEKISLVEGCTIEKIRKKTVDLAQNIFVIAKIDNQLETFFTVEQELEMAASGGLLLDPTPGDSACEIRNLLILDRDLLTYIVNQIATENYSTNFSFAKKLKALFWQCCFSFTPLQLENECLYVGIEPISKTSIQSSPYKTEFINSLSKGTINQIFGRNITKSFLSYFTVFATLTLSRLLGNYNSDLLLSNIFLASSGKIATLFYPSLELFEKWCLYTKTPINIAVRRYCECGHVHDLSFYNVYDVSGNNQKSMWFLCYSWNSLNTKFSQIINGNYPKEIILNKNQQCNYLKDFCDKNLSTKDWWKKILDLDNAQHNQIGLLSFKYQEIDFLARKNLKTYWEQNGRYDFVQYFEKIEQLKNKSFDSFIGFPNPKYPEENYQKEGDCWYLEFVMPDFCSHLNKNISPFERIKKQQQ